MSGKAKDVELVGVSKDFGTVQAVRPLTMRIESGEFLTLLGPSGCGKTTLLRLIAGLEQVSGGLIMVGGEDVTGHPPNRRDTSIMFQDYALFPHKSLLDNVAYGLKMRRIARPEREARARSWLKTIGLEDHEGRLPHQLSGGQRQRVALARSLIIEPGVLLLDEPLGALDANLRQQMRYELRRIHKEVGLTFIYVTHDQEEALAMSDRVAVMRDGCIEQLDAPVVIYDSPATEFVARFVGVCNVIVAIVRRHTEFGIECDADGLPLLVEAAASGPEYESGDSVALAVRPEAISIRQDLDCNSRKPNKTTMQIMEVTFTGSTLKIRGAAPNGIELDIEVSRQELRSIREPAPGGELEVEWHPADLSILRQAASNWESVNEKC